ncbi:hypothetical protein C0Q70_15657 [Pomacea canaliculata]|uniref:MAGE domain-containing protein n=2 Tax=Pomacea canaliculata TaxID=400727 RepID=A0A2T7NVF7_POMCA|nr:hypothetical protein C0Q70_15657 [Pomacea canaliculata]
MKEHSKGLPAVMKIAADHLQKVFGIEIVELQDKLKGSYILINKMKDPTHLAWNDADNAKTGLLVVVLSIIFMSGNVVQDGELWHSLRGFGVNPDQHHETFGDVKKLVMQEFVKQAYLETTRVPNSDPSVYEVRWGQRAMHETSKKDILKFVCLLYKMEPAQWASQYQDAMEEEETARNAAAGSV